MNIKSTIGLPKQRSETNTDQPSSRATRAHATLLQLQTAILEEPSLTELKKAEILIKLGESDKKLTDGADESLQLLDILSFICARMQ